MPEIRTTYETMTYGWPSQASHCWAPSLVKIFDTPDFDGFSHPAFLAPTELVGAISWSACTAPRSHQNPPPPRAQTNGYANNDPRAQIVQFPWHEILLRRLRDNFQPLTSPTRGYTAFANQWRTTVNLPLIAQRHERPVLTWLGHAGKLLQVGERHHGAFCTRRKPAPVAATAPPNHDLRFGTDCIPTPARHAPETTKP